MTVPASGSLQFSGIFSELNEDDYSALNDDGTSFGLKEMSTGLHGTINVSNMNANKPDGSAPHAISEFYKYDHADSVGSSPLSMGTYGYNSTGPGTITVDHAAYSTWYVSSKPSWVTITSGNYGSGNTDTGPGSVTFSLSTNSGSYRSGDIVIAYTVGVAGAAHPGGTNSATTRTTTLAQSGAPSGPPGVPPGGGGNGRGFNP